MQKLFQNAEMHFRDHLLPVEWEIDCGQGQCHGYGAKFPRLWRSPFCHWCSRMRNYPYRRFLKRKTCCQGGHRSHLLPETGEGHRKQQHSSSAHTANSSIYWSSCIKHSKVQKCRHQIPRHRTHTQTHTTTVHLHIPKWVLCV